MVIILNRKTDEINTTDSLTHLPAETALDASF